MDIAAVFLVMTADMVEANLGQRVSQPMWDAPQLGAKQNKSSAVPGMKYTWVSSLLNWKQAFLSLQQLSHKCSHLHPYHPGDGHRGINSHDKQTLLKHCSLSIHPHLSLWAAACTTEQSVVSPTSKPASRPASQPAHPLLQVEGRTSKGAEKLKGTLFIRPWHETYWGSAGALNQPWLLDMLKWRVVEQDRLEKGRVGQRWRQTQRKI